MFKYNETRIDTALEEEEERASRPWDRGANKRVHMYHLYVILYL